MSDGQVFPVLDQHRFLQQNDQEGDNIAEDITRSALIIVLRIKCVIQACELRDDDKDSADYEKHLTDTQLLWLEPELALIVQQVIEIPRYKMRDENLEKIDQTVADPDHAAAEITDIAAIEIGSPVRQQKQHGGECHHRQNTSSPGGQGFGYRCQNGKNTADPAHKQHDVELMFFQECHMIPLSVLMPRLITEYHKYPAATSEKHSVFCVSVCRRKRTVGSADCIFRAKRL